MKQGTWSVLFGCHSFVHSLIVIVAWRKLYGHFPSCWQIVCILLHDVGHWGKNYLDDYDAKKKHGLLGASIAWQLFGTKGYDLVAGHNLYNGAPKSLLHDPDKYSWVIAPVWWMITNCIFEPKLQRVWRIVANGKEVTGKYTKRQSALMFKDAMIKNWHKGWPDLGHEIYLKQWNTTKENNTND